MVSRRSFIKGVAAAGTLAAAFPQLAMANNTGKQIGIQLYTIRDLVKEDFMGTMQILADIGFNIIETAEYSDRKFYGYDPADFNRTVREFGIKPLSSHSYVTRANISQTIEDTAKSGMKYLVQPYVPESMRKSKDDYKRIADDLNRFGELCKTSGLTFAYHNHAFEFEKIESDIPYNLLLENTDPNIVTMELDTYWMVYGGYQPIDYFNSFPGRFKLIHVKDMAEGEDKKSTEIGRGLINFPEIFEMKDLSGMENFFLEQEDFDMDPWDSLTQSFTYMKTLPQ
ncbi:MAG: sugar phosphate isomerase/epimerase [Bacteroidales bacterium]